MVERMIFDRIEPGMVAAGIGLVVIALILTFSGLWVFGVIVACAGFGLIR